MILLPLEPKLFPNNKFGNIRKLLILIIRQLMVSFVNLYGWILSPWSSLQSHTHDHLTVGCSRVVWNCIAWSVTFSCKLFLLFSKPVALILPGVKNSFACGFCRASLSPLWQSHHPAPCGAHLLDRSSKQKEGGRSVGAGPFQTTD